MYKKNERKKENNKTLHHTTSELQCPLIATHICTAQQPAVNHTVKNSPYNINMTAG